MLNSYSLESRERKARKKAFNAGYQVKKGFTHWLSNNSVYTNMSGERFTGYEIWELSSDIAVLGVDSNFDYNATLEEVESYLKTVYKEHGLKY